MANLNDLERSKLQRASSLHWFHWSIVSLSVAVTLGAWYYSDRQLEQKCQDDFEREVTCVLDLVKQRMEKYEDALWSGVALIDTLDGELTNRRWSEYAANMRLDIKYPGINGIGVAHALTSDQLPAYLARERVDRPDFRVHPEHDGDEFYPITYIQPLASNAQAVGLDMAHEASRFSAARRARDSGQAQITGPIALVQDAGQTAGFLFYAPFYSIDGHPDANQREQTFAGMVYAPFVVDKLMTGALAMDRRRVTVSISDGSDVLLDERAGELHERDPAPLFASIASQSMYGRNWTFDIHSARSFRAAYSSAQPLLILIGGISIDLMLVAFFILMTRANRRALAFADSATAELVDKERALEDSNAELERFAFVASHDLQEPLRMVSSFAGLLGDQYKDQFDDQGTRWLGFMVDGATRMQALVQGLLEYSRVGRDAGDPAPTDMNGLFDAVIVDLNAAIREAGALVTRDELPQVIGHDQQLRLVLQNLVANAIKFSTPEGIPTVHVGARIEDGRCTFSVADNGIGIDPKYADRIFVIFQRLHANDAYAGTGIGLAVTKKVVDRHAGKLWFESTEGKGATFFFTLPPSPEGVAPSLPTARRTPERILS